METNNMRQFLDLCFNFNIKFEVVQHSNEIEVFFWTGENTVVAFIFSINTHKFLEIRVKSYEREK